MARQAILVSGHREWQGAKPILREMKKYPPGTIVIHGNAPGADSYADQIGQDLGHVVVRVPYIKKLGRSGGPARNGYMLKLLLGLKCLGFDVKVLAFHSNIVESRGTKDMVEKATKALIEVEVFSN